MSLTVHYKNTNKDNVPKITNLFLINMDLLPLEIIEYIARIDHSTWYKLVQVCRFLSEKTLDNNYVSDLKRKFLLCSTISQDIIYNRMYRYKYNDKFHVTDEQKYKIVYYLPNGNLHTFDDPCIAISWNRRNLLHIWFKDNKIHRDNDLPAVIHDMNGSTSIWNMCSIKTEEVFKDILQYFPGFYILDYIHMWFKNGLPHRDNDLPAIIRKEYMEWRRHGLLYKSNNL
jgi:hypothetical protein